MATGFDAEADHLLRRNRDVEEDGLREEAPKTDPRYFFRPYKTILVRTVADGGESYYVRGDHRSTVPTLYHLIGARAVHHAAGQDSASRR